MATVPSYVVCYCDKTSPYDSCPYNARQPYNTADAAIPPAVSQSAFVGQLLNGLSHSVPADASTYAATQLPQHVMAAVQPGNKTATGTSVASQSQPGIVSSKAGSSRQQEPPALALSQEFREMVLRSVRREEASTLPVLCECL